MVGIELGGFARSQARIGHQVTLAARRRGAIIRPLGDVVVLMPPLSITAAELRAPRRDHRGRDRRGDERRAKPGLRRLVS